MANGRARTIQGRKAVRGKASPTFYTSELAAAAGVHPNTVRLYEALGLLPPALRTSSGYRLFTEHHLSLLLLARTALGGPFSGSRIRRSATAIIQQAAQDPRAAAAAMPEHLALVREERREAEAAAAVLEAWAQDAKPAAEAGEMRIAQAARILGVSADMLRNWERNGLLRVPRQERSRYRLYGPSELARAMVIRTLLRAGYSTMAILRMFRRFDRGLRRGLKKALDTPHSDLDLVSATDGWLTRLADAERRARSMRAQLARIAGSNDQPPWAELRRSQPRP